MLQAQPKKVKTHKNMFPDSSKIFVCDAIVFDEPAKTVELGINWLVKHKVKFNLEIKR